MKSLMEESKLYTARVQVVEAMEQGLPWHEAAKLAGIQISQSTSYRLRQLAEGLSDRQAADAVRGRLDWKYLLGLEMTDAGFDASVLCDFRTRLLDGGAEQQVLQLLLDIAMKRGWLKAHGKQRTDSTHVLVLKPIIHGR